MSIRINLYFPDNHELKNIPKKQRSQYTKALIEHALIHKERIDHLEHSIDKLLALVIQQSEQLDTLEGLIRNTEGGFVQQRNTRGNEVIPISEFGLIDQIKKIKNK